MNRLISYGFIILTIYLFILEGNGTQYTQIFIGITLSVIVAYSAFFLNWITLDATLPVMVLGTIILGFGGWWLALAVIFFFISSSYLTHRNRYRTIRLSDKDLPQKDSSNRRDGIQVWANGFWMILFTYFWFLLQSDAFLIAAFAAIATATADTWATEMGTEKPGVTKNILTREIVKPGTDGGVSFVGTVASLAGAFIIALFTISLHVDVNTLFLILIVSIAGFLGCVIDSYIGAVYQSGKPDKTGLSKIVPKNSIVNWLSTGIGGIIALLLYSIV
ncbi:MAG: DUF92 domain-containing protein [Balneolaceae bacterium]